MAEDGTQRQEVVGDEQRPHRCTRRTEHGVGVTEGSPGGAGDPGEARGSHSPGLPPQPAGSAAHSGILGPGATDTPAPGRPQAPGSRITGTLRCPGARPPTWVKVAAVPSVSAAPGEGRGGVGRGAGNPAGPPGLSGTGPLAPRHCGPLGPVPAAAPRPRHGRAGTVPPAPRGQGRAAARAAGTAAEGRLDLPRGPPRSPRRLLAVSPVAVSPLPVPRCPGAPRPLPLPLPRCRRSPPAPAAGPALPTPSSRRARRSARRPRPRGTGTAHTARGRGRAGPLQRSLAAPPEGRGWAGP